MNEPLTIRLPGKPRPRPTVLTTLLSGGLFVGSIDALYAIAFWVPRGAKPVRIFQSIAAGLLGRASFEGGTRTAWLGLVLHYFIATMIVVVYWVASKRLNVLLRRPVICGALYGLVVYAVMNYVVIPLSATSRPRFLLSWVVCSIVVHALFIGIPAAFFARMAVRPATAQQ
jgi:hypothetical protein